MKRVVALTAIEPPFRGRLVETQFLKPLSAAFRRMPGTAWEYLALVPFPFRFARRSPGAEFLRTRSGMDRIVSQLNSTGANATFILSPYPWHPRQFNLTARQAIAFAATSFPLLLTHLSRRPASLIIARSYPAALLARLAKVTTGTPYLFDMRGLYPEECANAGVFETGSTDHLFWKRRERQLVSDASGCLVVSEPFREHVSGLVPKVRASVIPCCADPEDARFDQQLRSSAKRKHGLGGRFVLLHLGSFGTRGDRGLAARYLHRFKRARPDAVLVAATGTTSFVPEIRGAFVREGLAPDDFRVINPRPDQLPEIRAMGDAGLILERRVANTHVCLSVKLGEYLASGLPVICTPFVEGAARLVRGFDCGLVVDPDDPGAPLDKEKEFLKRYPDLRANGLKLAGGYLSLDNCARLWRRAIARALQ